MKNEREVEVEGAGGPGSLERTYLAIISSRLVLYTLISKQTKKTIRNTCYA